MRLQKRGGKIIKRNVNTMKEKITQTAGRTQLGEFAPMFASCESRLAGRRLALFGSYGWGSGEWMQSWEETCVGDGAVLACDSVICCEEPDDEALEACHALGAALCA